MRKLGESALSNSLVCSRFFYEAVFINIFASGTPSSGSLFCCVFFGVLGAL